MPELKKKILLCGDGCCKCNGNLYKFVEEWDGYFDDLPQQAVVEFDKCESCEMEFVVRDDLKLAKTPYSRKINRERVYRNFPDGKIPEIVN